jgi:hypothetical protein
LEQFAAIGNFKMHSYKHFLIRFCTFVAGLYFVLKFIIPKNEVLNFENFHEHVVNGFACISVMAVGLGLINLLFMHGSRLAYKKKDWFFSAVLLLGLLTMTFVQMSDWILKNDNASVAAKFVNLSDFSKVILKDQAIKEENSAAAANLLPRAQREELLIAEFRKDYAALPEADQKQFDSIKSKVENLYTDNMLEDSEHKEFQETVFSLSNSVRTNLDLAQSKTFLAKLNEVLGNGLFVSLGSAMFALLGFYIAAAAYRAFRIKTIEAALMMTAAVIVMLGQIPFGVWLSADLPELRLWLLQVPSAGAARAIEMGAAIAGLILAFRMWLSLDRQE